MRSSTLALFGLSLGFALACGGGEKPAENTTPPPPPPPTEQATTAPGGIGVAECDDYLKKVDECLGKLDATSKAAYESSQKQVTDAWRQAASTDAGKAGLSMGCKAALDSFTCPATAAGGTGTATGTTGTTGTTEGTTGTAGTKTEEATGTSTPSTSGSEKSPGRPGGEPTRRSGEDAEGMRHRPTGGTTSGGTSGGSSTTEGSHKRPGSK